MIITLTAEQQRWLEAHVAAGDFASLDQAARQRIDERIAERAVEIADDLTWAKPDADEARGAVARGEYVTLDDYNGKTAALLASLKN